jgi:hypothetical protein
VRQALEKLAVENLQGANPPPTALTEDKLKEMLGYSCTFIEEYLNLHPNMHPMEVIILKMREADEIYKVFGFDELEIASAITAYNIETSPAFEEIRQRLNEVT